MNTRKIRRIFRNFKNRPNKQQAEQIKMQKIVQKGAYETTTGKLQKTENLNSGGTGKTLKRG